MKGSGGNDERLTYVCDPVYDDIVPISIPDLCTIYIFIFTWLMGSSLTRLCVYQATIYMGLYWIISHFSSTSSSYASHSLKVLVSKLGSRLCSKPAKPSHNPPSTLLFCPLDVRNARITLDCEAVLDTGEDLDVVFDFVGDEDVFGFATLFEGERTVGFGTGEEDGFCMKVLT
jgi:hypothetical protein